MSPQSLTIPSEATYIGTQMYQILLSLSEEPALLVPNQSFQKRYTQFLQKYEAYQSAILAHSGKPVFCTAGCGTCCGHWAEDIFSFEIHSIGEYLKSLPLPQQHAIIDNLEDDCRMFSHLKDQTYQALQKNRRERISEKIDPTDLLLSAFFQQNRPCPLLDNSGNCSVYPIRPLTCRSFVSFAPPKSCHPDFINHEKLTSYIIWPEPKISKLLDTLHRQYQKISTTALRPGLLWKLKTPLEKNIHS